MKELVNEIIETDFDDLENIKIPIDKRVGLIVYKNSVKFEFLLNIKSKSDKLLVLSSGALPRGSSHDRNRPLFHRWSWDFEQSTIHFNDPTLYLSNEILGGWGLGSMNYWCLKHLSVILEKLFKILSYENKNIIFEGFSLGGFISLMLGTMIKDSVVIAEIPQFDVTLWGYHWYLLKKHLFNDLPTDEIRKKYNYKLNLLELIKIEKYIPNAYILMDCSYDYDFKEIYSPFFKQLDELPYKNNKNSLKLIVYGKMVGHRALPKEELLKVIKKVSLLMDVE